MITGARCTLLLLLFGMLWKLMLTINQKTETSERQRSFYIESCTMVLSIHLFAFETPTYFVCSSFDFAIRVLSSLLAVFLDKK